MSDFKFECITALISLSIIDSDYCPIMDTLDLRRGKLAFVALREGGEEGGRERERKRGGRKGGRGRGREREKN